MNPVRNSPFKSFSLYIPGIVALVALVVGFVVANAFTSPTLAPPLGNVPSPLNIGPSSQAKAGNLALNTSNLFANGLLVPFGNVGIGTTAPGALLHVSNSANSIRQIRIQNVNAGTTAQAGFSLASADGEEGGLALTGQSYTTGTWDRQDAIYLQAAPSAAGGLAFAARATTGGIITFHAGGDSERVRITESGNVGIGTASPGAKLDVAGAIRTGPQNAVPFPCAAAKQGTMYFNSTTIKYMLCNGSVWVDYTGPQGPPGPSTGIAANVTPDANNTRDLGTSSLFWRQLFVTKLTANTIDPVYEIDGKKYATYVADVAGGVKTEVTGSVNVKCQMSNVKCQYVIDFDEQKTGSDLWLFWQTSNKNVADIVVLLTPSFDGGVWYKKDASNNRIIIKSNSNGPASTRSLGEAGEVSFRFTAPRKDAAQWPNEIKE